MVENRSTREYPRGRTDNDLIFALLHPGSNLGPIASALTTTLPTRTMQQLTSNYRFAGSEKVIKVFSFMYRLSK